MTNCIKCSDYHHLKCRLLKNFENQLVGNETNKSWISTNRTTLKTTAKPVEEFVDHLLASLNKLQKHDFIAKQSSFLKRMKTPEMNYVIVIADFAENYSFVIQDEA